MNLPVVLAHGALGAFDELIFGAVALAFVGMMIFAWVRARSMQPDEAIEGEVTPDAAVVEERDPRDRYELE